MGRNSESPPEQAIEKENRMSRRLSVDNIVYVSKIFSEGVLLKEHEIEVIPAFRL